MQNCPYGHTVPQPPQSRASVCVSTHAPEHSVWPTPHDDAHAPFEHTCPALHGVVHDEQCSGSLMVSTHAAPHGVSPVGHAHSPAAQLCPCMQMCPHDPQLAGSVCRLAHPDGQICCPAVHLFPMPLMQVPPEQTVLAPHALAHAPQLPLLVLRSTHAPPQLVSPA